MARPEQRAQPVEQRARPAQQARRVQQARPDLLAGLERVAAPGGSAGAPARRARRELGAKSRPAVRRERPETAPRVLLADRAARAASCIEKLSSGYVVRTDGSLVYFTGSAIVLDDATGMPLTGVVSLQDNDYQGAGCAALSRRDGEVLVTMTSKAAVGQLGNGTTAASNVTFHATLVVATGGAPLANVAAMAHGDYGTANCAVTTAGQLYCWGDLKLGGQQRHHPAHRFGAAHHRRWNEPADRRRSGGAGKSSGSRPARRDLRKGDLVLGLRGRRRARPG